MTNDAISSMPMVMLGTTNAIHNTKNVSRETLGTFENYVSLLLKWNARINLIGPMTEADIWSRHIEDSLQLVPLIPSSATSLVDLGSGAGLPGMVIAIAKPELKVTLVEQDQRKAAFLTEVKHRLNLSNVVVEAKDIKAVEDGFDVVTARALASLDALLSFAKPLMGQGSVCLFPKGENHQNEIAKAQQNWAFEHTEQSSITLSNASVITISKLTSKRTAH